MFFKLAFLFVVLNASGVDVQGVVSRVVDGDTLVLQNQQQKLRVRLNGIDAPELKQPFGVEAKQRLEVKALGRRFVARCVNRDPYGRELCFLYDQEQNLLNLELVEDGCAWAYKGRGRVFREAQERARLDHRGLWSDPNPTPPWEWRGLNQLEQGVLQTD